MNNFSLKRHLTTVFLRANSNSQYYRIRNNITIVGILTKLLVIRIEVLSIEIKLIKLGQYKAVHMHFNTFPLDIWLVFKVNILEPQKASNWLFFPLFSSLLRKRGKKKKVTKPVFNQFFVVQKIFSGLLQMYIMYMVKRPF